MVASLRICYSPCHYPDFQPKQVCFINEQPPPFLMSFLPLSLMRECASSTSGPAPALLPGPVTTSCPRELAASMSRSPYLVSAPPLSLACTSEYASSISSTPPTAEATIERVLRATWLEYLPSISAFLATTS